MGCAESKNETRVEADWNSEYGKRADAEMKKKRMSLARQRELFQSQDNIAFVDNKVQTVNGYTLGKVLGKGAYGEVFLAHKGGDKFAIKVLKNLKGKNLSAPKLLKRPGPPGGPPGLAKGSSKSSFDSVQTEIATMRKIMHPNLVHMFDVVVDIARSEVYVVLEFVDGGASQRMDKDGNPIPLAEETMWSHTRHLLLGLEFLHMQGIVHRDIKPENLLLTKDGMLKIADFGTARIMEDEEAGAKGTVGTPFFFSPEMCVKGAQGTFDGRAVDLWAVGVTMFVWTSGQMPFSAPTEYMLMESIREAPAQVAPPSGASVSLGAVVSGLLTKEPSKRLTLNQLRLHPWLTQEGKKPVPQQPVVKIEVTDDDIEAAFTAAANRMAIRYQSAAGPSALGRATGQIPDWRREGDNVIRKRTGELEAEHFRTIASDGDLTNHVPIIYEIGEVPEEQGEDDDPYEASATGAGSHAVRMQDLAAGMTRPCAMAVVMGCRTVTPADFADESPSADLLERMKAFGGEPSAEEEAAGGVSLRRYLGFLDASSSTASLGFRVDACKTVFDGELQPLPLPDDGVGQPLSLETLKEAAQVQAALSRFLQDDHWLCKAVLQKLEALEAALGRSPFFASHVLLRSTLLLVYDDAARSKVELKMLNFGNSYAVPAGAAASHAALSWGGTADAHEDGYLAGLRSLLDIMRRCEASHAVKNRQAIAYQSASGPSALSRATGQIPNWRREDGSSISKHCNAVEAEHFRSIGADKELTNHIPTIYDIRSDDDAAAAGSAQSHAVRMQDLAAGMTRPCAMAVVMGCRTVTPADFADESPSADLLERMKAFGGEPSAEEEAAGGVSLRRYLGFLDASSSTASLGFRVDACKTVFDGELQPLPLPEDLSLETLNDASDVEEAISLFLQGDYSLCKAVLRQLDALQAALGRSAFFASRRRRHVLLRSTLLLVYDDAARSKVELKMLNFGNSYAVPAGAAASHAALSWGGTADAHEDGYLAGVRSLAKLLKNLRGSRLQAASRHEKLEISALKGRRLSSVPPRDGKAVAGSKGRRLSSMPGNSGSKLSRSDTSNSCGISNLSASVGRKDRKSSSSASAGALTEEDPSPASQASSRGRGGPGSARGAKKLSLSKGPGMRPDELQ